MTFRNILILYEKGMRKQQVKTSQPKTVNIVQKSNLPVADKQRAASFCFLGGYKMSEDAPIIYSRSEKE